ncbi:MAG: hypothetical protein WBR24_16175 [Desulfobacterales bacterium]|jgi:hypothetical protein
MEDENFKLMVQNSHQEVKSESVKLRQAIKNTADVLNETNRILSEASLTQGRQNRFLLWLTMVIAVSTAAYCLITWYSVVTLKEANRIQSEILLINKRGENLTNYLLKDEIDKMGEDAQQKPMNNRQ